MLHTDRDLRRIAAKVKSRAQPWTAGWNTLTASSHSQFTWVANPQPVVYRGSGTPENYGALYRDLAAAYQNALRWRIGGDTRHADCARNILNAWSTTLTKVTGTADAAICAGIQGYQYAAAVDLMRGYSKFNLDAAKTTLTKVFYTENDRFLNKHNGAYPTNYWPSWDYLTLASIMAIGAVTEDRVKMTRAANYLVHGTTSGALPIASPKVFPDGTAELVEVGRDQGHALLSIGLLGTLCEIAWNQGIDLYAVLGNRVMRMAEYTAKWNLGHNVPFTPWVWKYGCPYVWGGQETLTAASTNGRGQTRPIWATLHNHYALRRKLHVPYITAMMKKVAPEAGGGQYGPNSGGYDHLGYGTLVSIP